MEFKQDFIELPVEAIHTEAAERKAQGWRYVQILAVNLDDGADVVYSYMKDGKLDNLVVKQVPRAAEVPSITDLYLEAFVCENEIHDLFGIKFAGLLIDFLGNFYKLSTELPMTIISPEQLARREKEAKAAALKAEKAAKDANKEAGASDASDKGDVKAAADLEAKLAGMDPEKAAKVRAAMEAKAKKAAAADKAGD